MKNRKRILGFACFCVLLVGCSQQTKEINNSNKTNMEKKVFKLDENEVPETRRTYDNLDGYYLQSSSNLATVSYSINKEGVLTDYRFLGKAGIGTEVDAREMFEVKQKGNKKNITSTNTISSYRNSEIEVEYDELGKIISQTIDDYNIAYTYDEQERVTTRLDTFGFQDSKSIRQYDIQYVDFDHDTLVIEKITRYDSEPYTLKSQERTIYWQSEIWDNLLGEINYPPMFAQPLDQIIGSQQDISDDISHRSVRSFIYCDVIKYSNKGNKMYGYIKYYNDNNQLLGYRRKVSADEYKDVPYLLKGDKYYSYIDKSEIAEDKMRNLIRVDNPAQYIFLSELTISDKSLTKKEIYQLPDSELVQELNAIGEINTSSFDNVKQKVLEKDPLFFTME